MDDIKTKMKIAAKVVSMCEQCNSYMKPDRLFTLYTGYPANQLLYRNTYPFQKFMDAKHLTPKKRMDLRDFLVGWYLTLEKIPTFTEIVRFAAVTACDEVDTFFYKASQDGFVWKNIPGTTKAIFIEKYENIAKRLKYLIKMKEYRQYNRHIVYLESFSYKNFEHEKNYIAVSNKHGILSLGTKSKEGVFKSIFPHNTEFGMRLDEIVNLMKDVPKTKLQLAEKPNTEFWTSTQAQRYFKDMISLDRSKGGNEIFWIKEVFRTLKEPTVFVYENLPFTHQELFSPFTSKFVMKEYLTEIGIPFDPSAHRGELYHLIKTFTKDKCDGFTNIILNHNHEVALSPYGFEELDFFHWFWPENGTNDLSTDRFEKAEKLLIKSEETRFTEDRMMEEVIDKVMTKGKCEGTIDQKLTEYLTVMKYDYDYGHNSIFVE